MPTAVSWAGTMIGTVDGFANPIPFTEEEQTVSVRVWTPAAGTPILLKAEMLGDSPFYTETIQYTSQEGWETLQFNFGNELPGTPELEPVFPHHLLVIFFGFGDDGVEGGTTYYFDDVYFGQAPVVGIGPTPPRRSPFPESPDAGQPLRGSGFGQKRTHSSWTLWAAQPGRAALPQRHRPRPRERRYTVVFQGPQGLERQRLLIQ